MRGRLKRRRLTSRRLEPQPLRYGANLNVVYLDNQLPAGWSLSHCDKAESVPEKIPEQQLPAGWSLSHCDGLTTSSAVARLPAAIREQPRHAGHSRLQRGSRICRNPSTPAAREQPPVNRRHLGARSRQPSLHNGDDPPPILAREALPVLNQLGEVCGEVRRILRRLYWRVRFSP